MIEDRNDAALDPGILDLDSFQGDDGKLLMALALYKADLLAVIGKAKIVDFLRAAVDRAPTVKYYSKRARAAIDPLRPSVMLKVPDEAAWAAYPRLGDQVGFASLADLVKAPWEVESSQKKVIDFKVHVIREEVCDEFSTFLSDALAPHWEKSKRLMDEFRISHDEMQLIMSSMFEITVGGEKGDPHSDRSCVLSVIL